MVEMVENEKKWYFVEHPQDSSLQLSCAEGVLLLFTSQADAEQRRDKVGSGNVRGFTLEELAEKFSGCGRVVLDPSENPMPEEAMRICELQ